jgi:hypothetical protein
MMKINVTIARKGEDLSDRSLITGLTYKSSIEKHNPHINYHIHLQKIPLSISIFLSAFSV